MVVMVKLALAKLFTLFSYTHTHTYTYSLTFSTESLYIHSFSCQKAKTGIYVLNLQHTPLTTRYEPAAIKQKDVSKLHPLVQTYVLEYNAP